MHRMEQGILPLLSLAVAVEAVAMRLASCVASFTKHRHIQRRPHGWDFDPECELVSFAGSRIHT